MTEKKQQVNKTEDTTESLLQEIEEQEILEETAGGAWWQVSKNLGNQGRVCTLTKECQSNCN